MDVLAGQTFSAPLPVTVGAVGAELPTIDDGLLREHAEYWQETPSDAPEPLEVPADHPRPGGSSPASGWEAWARHRRR